jgi:hypothetical protein
LLVDAFTVVFAELRGSPHVQIHTIHDQLVSFSDDIQRRTRDEIRRRTGFELSPDLMAGMNVSNGAGAYWTCQIAGFRGAGEFKLRHLREVFLYEEDPLWTEETPPGERAFLSTLRYFDYRPGAGDNKFAAFALEPGVMPPHIWYYDRGQCIRMMMSYEEYLQALIITKGITDWQYFFCDVDWGSSRHHGLDHALRQRLDALASTFPHHDYASFYARLPQRDAS